MIRAFITGIILAAPTVAAAEVLDVRPVTEGVWAIVGEKEQRSPENLGNNATFGLVVTDAGAVLIDPGGSWQGAEMLHDAIRSVTDQPVTYVINTGGGIVRLNPPDRVGTRSFGCLRVALLGDNQANKGVLSERRDSGRQEIGQSV